MRKIDLALDTQKELLLKIIENPKEMDKLPRKSLLLPKEKIVVPFKDIKMIGDILVLPYLPAIAKFRKKL